MDLFEDAMWLEQLKNDFVNPVTISAKLNQNLETLIEKIQQNFVNRMQKMEIIVAHSRMDLVDLFYREGKVEEIKYLQKGIKIKLTLPKIASQKLLQDKEISKLN